MKASYTIQNEEELLNESTRANIIQQIEGSENERRKFEAFKRYECYKDLTIHYVLDQLLKMFDPETVWEMQYSLSNISIVRKIVNKLARVYASGVTRELEGASDEELLDFHFLEDFLQVSKKMDKANAFLKLQKNASIYVKPYEAEEGRYSVKLHPLQPFNYDVIEKPNDREEPLAYILSHYEVQHQHRDFFDRGRPSDGRFGRRGRSNDGADQYIADSPRDSGAEKSKSYIWWTDSYHFTTNEKGKIIQEEGDTIENPISILPFVNLAEDQDGAFWAMGGSDLIDGGISVNTMLTNLNHIGITQGYGQLVMTGKDLPDKVMLGPNKALKLEQNEGEPTPTTQFITANPPLEQLMRVAEAYVAMILTTNNLSTSNFSTSLSGAAQMASGIAMIIDKSESIEDVEEQQEIFKIKEPEVWKRISRWLDYYGSRGALIEELQNVRLDEAKTISTNFGSYKPVMGEEERLRILQMRKDMGLDTMLDTIMRDMPDLTEEQAEERLMRILEERASSLTRSIVNDTEEEEDDNDLSDSE